MSAFDDFRSLKEEMSVFTEQFKTILNNKKNNIIQSKQEFEIELAATKLQINQLSNEIKSLKTREQKIKDSISKSFENIEIQQSRVDDLEARQKELIRQRNSLQETINDLNFQVKSLNDNLSETESDLKRQDLADYPELIKYEQYLGLRIEVLSVDVLRFIFNNIDPNDMDKEIWCDLSVGGELYKLGDTFPILDQTTIQLIEDDFNSHKEFVRFLKTIRSTLKEVI